MSALLEESEPDQRIMPMFLCILSLKQFKAIRGSDCLAPISRSGCGRLDDSKQFRYGHGRHAQAAAGSMAYKASGVNAGGLSARLQDLLGFKSGELCLQR